MPTVEDENVTVTNDGKRNINSNLETEENPKNGRKCKTEEDMTGPYSHIIKIKNFKISEANHMFINASLFIADGKRYGLVGLESCKITALLKHITNIPSGIDVLYWNEGIVDHMLPANKAVSKPSTRYEKLLAERENLIAEQHNGNDTENIRNRLAELWEEILMIDPEGTPARGKAIDILSGLGFSYLDIDETMINLPEHLRKRVSLARALYLEPALLILDEPTTELDLDAVLWLENYLQDWKKTLIVVSQDRCFLDNVCNEIIYVNQQQLLYYKGNHSFFEKKFAQKQRRNLKKKEKRKEKKIQLKADEKSRDTGLIKARAMSRSKSQNGSEVNDSGEGKEPVKLLQKPEFSFCDPIDVKRREFLQLMGITFGYKKEEGEEKDGKEEEDEDEDELLFEYLGLSISHRSRIAVLGPSRAGKSTLLKIANKELNVQGGRVYLKPWAIIGKFSQNDVDCLPSEESPLQYLCGKAVDQKSFRPKAVEKLIGLGLPNNRHSTKMEKLTVNEKALVALAKLCLFPHDLLILDEPTKNMSMDLIDALANAINQFKGAVF